MSKIFPFTETGYPPPPPDLRLGTPAPGPETGYPPHLNLGPPHLDLGPPPCGQTHRQVSKHYLPVVLRTRAVTNELDHGIFSEYLNT